MISAVARRLVRWIIVGIVAIIGVYLAAYAYGQRLVREWESVGGAVSVRLSVILGPVDISLGSVIGKNVNASSREIADLLGRLGRLPGCEKLSLSDLKYDAKSIGDFIQAFRPRVFTGSRISFDRNCLMILVEDKSIEQITLASIPMTVDDLLLLRDCPNLKLLRLSEMHFNASDIERLQKVFGNKLLVEEVSNPPVTDQEV